MNKVTFRCKRSGNTVSFIDPVDIESMRKETEYEEINDAVQEKKQEAAEEEIKKRGRPKNDYMVI